MIFNKCDNDFNISYNNSYEKNFNINNDKITIMNKDHTTNNYNNYIIENNGNKQRIIFHLYFT